MRLYTLVLDYAGGTYLEQVDASDATGAVGAWSDKTSGALAEVAELFERDGAPVSVSGLKKTSGALR
jgi:hypothetical protein